MAGRALRAPAARQLLPLGARQAARWYSIQPTAAAPLPLDATKLQITKTTSPKTPSDPKTLVFGREFTGTALAALPALCSAAGDHSC